MNSNRYLIRTLNIQINGIKNKKPEDHTEEDKKTILHLGRYVDFASSIDFELTKSNTTTCITPSKPLKYWGSSIETAHICLGGNKDTYNALLRDMGMQIDITSKQQQKKSSKNNKKKKRKRQKKNKIRKTRTEKLKKVKKSNQPKIFSASTNDFAKFKLKYNKIQSVKKSKKTYAPRARAIKDNLDLCSLPCGGEVVEAIDGMSEVMKINLGACYIDFMREKQRGEVKRQEIKDILPIIFNGCWGINNITINYCSSYFILNSVKDDPHTFTINPHFIKLFKAWREWDNNKFAGFFNKEINALVTEKETETETETENEIDNEIEEKNDKLTDDEYYMNDTQIDERGLTQEFNDILMMLKCDNIDNDNFCTDLDTANDVAGDELYKEYQQCRRLELESQKIKKMILNKVYSILRRKNLVTFDNKQPISTEQYVNQN